MEIAIIGLVFLILALVVRRREAFRFRWQPARQTWVALGAGLLAFLFSASLLLFPAGSAAAGIIHYGLIYVVCGAAIPWGYVLLVERGTPADLGWTRERRRASLILSAVMAALFIPMLFLEGDLGAVGWENVAKAAFVLAGPGGLFELFLYYGFIHIRLEKAFGVLPAILITSAVYVLWHTGTQFPLEDDLPFAVWKLFWVGVMSQSVFSLTRNLLVIWPLFSTVGVMVDFAVNIHAVDEVAVNVPWAAAAIAAMALVILLANLLAARVRKRAGV
jgi:membrane protease YdiL (CAAX protease family)